MTLEIPFSSWKHHLPWSPSSIICSVHNNDFWFFLLRHILRGNINYLVNYMENLCHKIFKHQNGEGKKPSWNENHVERHRLHVLLNYRPQKKPWRWRKKKDSCLAIFFLRANNFGIHFSYSFSLAKILIFVGELLVRLRLLFSAVDDQSFSTSVAITTTTATTSQNS